MKLIGWLMGIEDLESVDSARLAMTSPWARDSEFWILLGCLGFALLGLLCYLRLQRGGPFSIRTLLGFSRGAAAGSAAADIGRARAANSRPPSRVARRVPCVRWHREHGSF